jgi:hypothetical protein
MFTVTKIQVVTLWDKTPPCSDVVGYQRFGGTCCLHLQCVVNKDRKGGLEMGRKCVGGSACSQPQSIRPEDEGSTDLRNMVSHLRRIRPSQIY